MSKALELLDSEAHRELRLRALDEPFPHFVQIVAAEFVSAATCCPVLFTKAPTTGRFYAGAMYGFRPGEPLLGAAEEPPPYRPLDLERQGFFIADENIAIDPGDPRFDTRQGDVLFESDGSPSEMLRRMQRVLARLKSGVEETDAFIAAMLRHRLIEPIDVSLRFDDGDSLALQGLYTVSLDSLHDLPDAEALALFRQGYLQLAYCMIGSLKQIPRLAERRNRRLARAMS